MKQRLPFHEWLIISLILLIMVVLTIVTYSCESDRMPKIEGVHEIVSKSIQVYIRGAVVKPGELTLPKGTTLGEAIELAEALPEADLSKLKLTSRLRNNQHIYIPNQFVITVYLEGAVEQTGPLQVPLGTKLADLEHYTRFLPDSDLSILKKRRKLKDQETIVISRIN